MVAIIELFFAIVAALIEALIGCVELVGHLFAAVAEIVISVIFERTRADRRKKQSTPESSVVSGQSAPRPSRKLMRICLMVLFLFIIGLGVAAFMHQKAEKQQTAITRQLAAQLADSFSRQIKAQEVPEPNPGKLQDVDSWNRPMELFLDKFPGRSLIVVRSSGPDGRSGSIDDILEVRTVVTPVKQLAGQAINRGAKEIKDRIERMLPDAEDELPPNENDGK